MFSVDVGMLMKWNFECSYRYIFGVSYIEYVNVKQYTIEMIHMMMLFGLFFIKIIAFEKKSFSNVNEYFGVYYLFPILPVDGTFVNDVAANAKRKFKEISPGVRMYLRI